MMHENSDPLMSDKDAELYLGLGCGVLKQWRYRGQFLDLLPPTRLGTAIRYRQSTLEKFIEARTGLVTPAPAAPASLVPLAAAAKLARNALVSAR